MNNLRNDKHCFVFLQGPHGPFFAQLAKMLRHAGARCIRVGFNRGDQAFWSPMSDYIAFRHDHSAWPETFERILTEHHVTDLVLYGDTRAIHAQAIEIAKARGIKIHVFEEGYLRPYWVTYERNGSNGHSRLMDMTLQEMQSTPRGLHRDLNTVAHRALIDYPRYFDPITKTTCPIEVALHRLEDNRLPPPGPFNRLLAKLQGVFDSATPFWR